VSLCLLWCLAHDVYCYHQIQAQKTAKLKRDEEMRKMTRSRLDDLLQLIETKQIDNQGKERLIHLSKRLNK
jgi:hypothetical protein